MTMKLLLLLFVVNLPSCWSLCDINAARRCAHVEGKCKKLGKWNKFAEDVAKQAAEVAGVLEPKVVEAFQVCNLWIPCIKRCDFNDYKPCSNLSHVPSDLYSFHIQLKWQQTTTL